MQTSSALAVVVAVVAAVALWCGLRGRLERYRRGWPRPWRARRYVPLTCPYGRCKRGNKPCRSKAGDRCCNLQMKDCTLPKSKQEQAYWDAWRASRVCLMTNPVTKECIKYRERQPRWRPECGYGPNDMCKR